MLTSYYAVTPPETPGAICISRGMPHRTRYRRYWPLAPGKWFKSVSRATYLSRYRTILDALDPERVWAELHELAAGAEPILLCFESPQGFCYRRLAARWLASNLGVTVPEGRLENGRRITVAPWEEQAQPLPPELAWF